MNEFLSINDRLAISRVNLLFNVSLPNCILEILKLRKDNPAQHRFVSVSIRSLCQIINQQSKVYSLLSTPVNKIPEWSEWILQFCFHYESTMSSSSRLPVSGNGDGTIQPNAKDIEVGPYIVVYGDAGTVGNSSSDQPTHPHELSWRVRASDTYTLVSNTLMSMGIDCPESLLAAGFFAGDSTDMIPSSQTSSGSPAPMARPSYAAVHPAPPDDEYDEMPPLIAPENGFPIVGTNSNSGGNNSNGGDMTAGLSDNMTDFELEAYLASFV